VKLRVDTRALQEHGRNDVRVRLLTYNVHKCIGGVDRRYAPERIREVIAHYAPDICLLQEVDEGCRRSERHRQVDLLGELLEMRHRTWFPNVSVRGGGQYGNAILSRWPLTETQNIDLSIPLKKKRSVLHGRYRIRVKRGRRETTRTLHVFNLHLGLSGAERKIQLRKFLASAPFAGFHPSTPVVVAGDFNDVWGSLGPLLAPAGFRGLTKSLRTFPAYAPMRALDAFYLRGDARLVALRRSRLDIAKRASDHLPLIADIELE
jgi:endonuclease/exonuclease/phosphatase family metal-dependent hydrolase